MSYKKIEYSQQTDLSVIRVRPPVPVDCTKLYKTSRYFDITSADAKNRVEYWESAAGTLTKSDVLAELYDGLSELAALGFAQLDSPEVIELDGITCDILEVTFNNLSAGIKLVELRAAQSSQVLETINIAANQIVTITVPKPYEHYLLSCPANIYIKLNKYSL